MKLNLKALLGVEGVSSQENERAVRIGGYISYVVLIGLLLVIVQIVIDYSDAHLVEWEATTIIVWMIFAGELVVNLILVDNKIRYLKHNWLNVVIVIIAFPWIEYGKEWAPLVRMLRLLLFMRVMSDIIWDVIKVLRRNNFGMVLLSALVFVVVSGAIFSAIENTEFAKGLWYALVTITTVGYGDVVPVTDHGKVFGAVLIMVGVVLFSLVTANISAFLIGSEQGRTEKDILHYVKLVKDHLDAQNAENDKQLKAMHHKIEHRLALMEEELSQKQTDKLIDELKEMEIKIFNESQTLKEKIDALDQQISQSNRTTEKT